MAQQVTKEQIKDVYGSTIFGDIDAGKLTGTLPAIDVIRLLLDNK